MAGEAVVATEASQTRSFTEVELMLRKIMLESSNSSFSSTFISSDGRIVTGINSSIGEIVPNPSSHMPAKLSDGPSPTVAWGEVKEDGTADDVTDVVEKKKEKKLRKKEKKQEKTDDKVEEKLEYSEPKTAKVTARAEGSKAGIDASATRELQDLREENRQLKDLNLKLQSEVAVIQKERTSLAQELETVKANFKQHLTNRRTQGTGGNEAELERMLAETREATESKERECETMRKDSERRLGDSKQFQDLKALLKKKTDEVKNLKQQVSNVGHQKKESDGGCIELEADSD